MRSSSETPVTDVPRTASSWSEIGSNPVYVAIARIAAAALVCLASTYFFLSGFTLSYIGIIRNEAVGWVPAVDHAFPYLYLVVVLGNVLTLLPALSDPRTRRAAWVFVAFLGTLGILLVVHVVRLSDAPGDWRSVVWSVLVTIPLAGLAVFDLGVYGRQIRWRAADERLSWWTPFLSAVAVSLVFFAIGISRSAGLIKGPTQSIGVLGSSLALHVWLFVFVVAALEMIRALLSRFQVKPKVRFTVWTIVMWLVIGLVLRSIGAPALSFDGSFAAVWSLACALPFALAIAALQIRLTQNEVPSDLAAMVVRLTPKSNLGRAVFAVLLLVTVYFVPRRIEAVDWNYVFQRFWTVLVWALLLILFAKTAKTSRHAFRVPLAIATLCVMAVLGLAQLRGIWLRLGRPQVASVLEPYSGLDVSFQLVSMAPGSLVVDRASDDFYALLKKNTLIDRQLAAPDLELANLGSPVVGPKPNIFVIVVDSLRQDYLSPYNHRIDFTPKIDSFAKESLVFQNAFTPYGGTGLAEPAVWSGVRIPNQQYIQPFSNVNTLEKLLAAGQYKRYLTRDQVVARLLQRWPSDVDLNAHVHYWTDYDFSVTLQELKEELEKPQTAPIFLFTQPQNVHAVSIYQRERAGFGLRRHYPGFKDRYADEVNRFDGLFGEFISFLKERGLYDNSIVVLTADHGDQLGEYGRFGHSASLDPVVIKVPLLIHIPPALASEFQADTTSPAFLTDIAPTIYALLGQKKTNQDPMFGRSLLDAKGEIREYPDYYVLQSSYAPVFGVLGKNGDTLYIADANAKRQSYYRLVDDPSGIHNVIDPETANQNKKIVEDYLERLNRLYKIEIPKE